MGPEQMVAASPVFTEVPLGAGSLASPPHNVGGMVANPRAGVNARLVQRLYV